MEEVAFNPMDPEFLVDPYPTYHRLRTEDPVHHSPLGFWILTRYEDVVAALRDPRLVKEPIAAFVAEHGSQEVLTRPIDRGFNRVLWLFPYALGVVAFAGVVVAARRWSRHGDAPVDGQTATAADEALNERLNDDLRDLD